MATTIITECGNCGVDADVHVLDGCDSEDFFFTFRVCSECLLAPDWCDC